MTTMRIDRFMGIVPRKPEHMLRDGEALIAHDVDLAKGVVEAFRTNSLVETVPDTSVRLYQVGCCSLVYDTCVDLATWLPECQRVYITGRMPYPEVGIMGPDCTISYQRLGVPQPTMPLVAVSTTTEVKPDVSEVSYVYTFKNNLGEEGAPSPVSNDVLKADDEGVVTLTGFQTAPFEYNVTTVCVYRRETGFFSGSEDAEKPVTGYYLVAEYPVGTMVAVDDISIMYLGRTIWTEGVEEPPRNLTNITAVGGSLSLVGSVANKLYFSKGGQPWNWPKSQEMTLDYNIVDIQDSNGVLYVLTDGPPYVVQGDGACDERQCREITELPYNMPLISCGYGRGSIGTPFGVIYSSNEGLIQISRDGAPLVITDQYFTQQQWRSLRPDTARLAYSNGMLFCVTDVNSFVFFINSRTYSQFEAKKLVTISDTPIDMIESDTGEVLMLMEGEIVMFNGGDARRKYLYKTAPQMATGGYCITSIQVDQMSDVTDYTVQCERGSYTVRFVGDVLDRDRLPRFGLHQRWWLTMEGSARVNSVVLASSYAAIGTNS